MMITSGKYFAFLALSISSLLYVAIQATIAPVSDLVYSSTSNAADCSTILGSPQFAWLCRVQEKLNASHNVSSSFYGMFADQVCDGDCRCVMGATGRGGRCGKRESDQKTFCICDYGKTPNNTVINKIYPGDCDVFPILGELVCGILDYLGNSACNADCQCSHGYNNTGNHRCGEGVGPAANRSYYCMCANGTNI